MIIKVIEKCIHDASKNKYTGTRVVYYEVKGAGNLLDALSSYEENFNSDNVVSSNDSFSSECLDSYVSSVAIDSE